MKRDLVLTGPSVQMVSMTTIWIIDKWCVEDETRLPKVVICL